MLMVFVIIKLQLFILVTAVSRGPPEVAESQILGDLRILVVIRG